MNPTTRYHWLAIVLLSAALLGVAGKFMIFGSTAAGGKDSRTQLVSIFQS